MIIKENWEHLQQSLPGRGVTLVAVSKKKPATDIQELYDLGQRDFGENYVQEIVDKQHVLPSDIKWHFIGHLQSNKVKYIAPFVFLIQTIDSLKLLEEVNKAAQKIGRVINVLLQIHIANEETKFGLDREELEELLVTVEAERSKFNNVKICGLMGMATNTDDQQLVQAEFKGLHDLLHETKNRFFAEDEAYKICSMGMSGDYELAIASGSNLVRIGSMIFGARHYTQ